MERIISSLLDTDLYKLTMAQVAFNQFPEAVVTYEFVNRGKTPFTYEFACRLQDQVDAMADLRLTSEEYGFMRSIRFFKPTFCEWFYHYRFAPSDISIEFLPWYEGVHNHPQNLGDIRISIRGPWFKRIFWEVPLMALMSELHFQLKVKDPEWEARITSKADRLEAAGVSWIDFGTRRRASFEVQDRVVGKMKKYDHFRGTSNVLLAMRHGVKSQGTVAHEMYQAMQAKYGVLMSNQMASEHWVREYGGDLGVMLPDTLTTDVFMRGLSLRDAKLFDGARQDSGDLVANAQKYIDRLVELGVDPKAKVLVPSDALTVDKAIDFASRFEGKVKGVTAGIGTHLTNDCGFESLNMVIKMTGADFGQGMVHVVKLSDTPGKHTGDKQRIAWVKQELGLA